MIFYCKLTKLTVIYAIGGAPSGSWIPAEPFLLQGPCGAV
jgi:hypothetical protein